MSPEVQHRLLRTIAETERAWMTASTTGAAHVQTVSNTLITLADATLYTTKPSPAPGELGKVHEAGVASMRWLRTTTKRLRAALGGAERAAAEIAASDERWGGHVAPVVDGFRGDLGKKERVLRHLERRACGARLDRKAMERDVATWLEAPECVVDGAATLLVAFEAEMETRDESGDDDSVSSTPRKGTPAGGGGGRDESPAVAFLRMAGQRSR